MYHYLLDTHNQVIKALHLAHITHNIHTIHTYMHTYPYLLDTLAIRSSKPFIWHTAFPTYIHAYISLPFRHTSHKIIKALHLAHSIHCARYEFRRQGLDMVDELIFEGLHIALYVCMHACMYVCMYDMNLEDDVCMYVRMHVCMYV
jgi:hypothetical protein